MADNPEQDAKPTGDQISAQIGENAHNAVVGKNVIQIGALQIPYYLAAIIALCMLMGLGFVAYPSVKPWLPKPLAFPPATGNETLILIATFQVTEGHSNTLAHREIRDKIRAKIQELHETNLRAEVEPTVLNSDQRTEAETLGKRYGASMVIWGDDTGARVTVNFLNLRQPDFYAARVTISETVRTQLANPSAYAQFITDDLPREMTFFTLFAIGQSYDLNTEYQLAIARIEAAVVLLPSTASLGGLAEAYFRLGWLYQVPSPNNLNQAIADYDKAIALNPNFAKAYNNRGTAHADQHKPDEAIADYNKAIALNPNFALPYNNRGITFGDQGKLAKAIADFDKAIALNPDWAPAYSNRGVTYAAQNQLDKAMADYNKAIELQPDFAKAYNNRGTIYAAEHKLDEAIVEYNQAIALQPNFAEAYFNRGISYDDQKKLEEAIADYDQAIRLKPNFAPAYNNRGNARKHQGTLEEAIIDYNRAIALDPDFALAYTNRGITLAALGKYKEAVDDFRHYIKLQPKAENHAIFEQLIAELEVKMANQKQ